MLVIDRDAHCQIFDKALTVTKEPVVVCVLLEHMLGICDDLLMGLERPAKE